MKKLKGCGCGGIIVEHGRLKTLAPHFDWCQREDLKWEFDIELVSLPFILSEVTLNFDDMIVDNPDEEEII